MFNLKENTDAELLEVSVEIERGINEVPMTLDYKTEAMLRKVIGPFMVAAVEEILRLRLELKESQSKCVEPGK